MSGGHTKFSSALHALCEAEYKCGMHFGDQGTEEEAVKWKVRVEDEYEALQRQNAELLAALRGYVGTIASGGGGDKDLFMVAIREADNKARAAIASAEGRDK